MQLRLKTEQYYSRNVRQTSTNLYKLRCEFFIAKIRNSSEVDA